MKHISRLQRWLREERGPWHGVLFDIDGTLVRGEKALPGALELFGYLDGIGCPYLLVTNDANRSHEEKSAALRAAGLVIEPDSILSAGDVLSRLSRERKLEGRRFFVMGDLGNPDYADRAGMVVTRARSTLDECAGVIVGEENYDWQPTFNAVINFFIRHPEAHFIVPNPDIYWPDNHGAIAIGAGAKARFIRSVLEDYGVSIQPEYLGKPYRAVYEFARARLAAIRGKDCESPERIVMVGDSLKGDIRGANRVGFLSVLVLTGITPERQLHGIAPDSELRPKILADSL